MPDFQQLSWAATGLQTEVATLEDFERRGWIETVAKNGLVYIAADQRYRARFILHLLRKKHLTEHEVDLVLSVQRPPYSTAAVDQILREHKRVDGHGAH